MHKFEEKGKKAEKKQSTAQNRTGIPTQMKIRLEQSTGYSPDDIRIHYNSDKPGQLDALAYTQGNQIYIGPGQERHLSHELGHVVQQKMGIVSPNTRHHSGTAMNKAAALERSVDENGAGQTVIQNKALPQQAVVQRMSVFEGETQKKNMYYYPDKGLCEDSFIPVCNPKNGKTMMLYGEKQEVDVPVVKRYKREGWHIQNKLTDYFPEEEIKKMTVASPKDFLEKAEKTQSILETAENEEKAIGILQDFLQTNLQTKIPVEKLKQKPPVEILSEIQKQITLAYPLFSPQENISFRELEKKGKYKPVADIDPYYNHKKMAMFCIAQKATLSGGSHSRDVGPHIAITVLGQKIFIAMNTTFREYHAKEPAGSTDLSARVRKAIDELSQAKGADRIEEILKDSNKRVPKTDFEDQKKAGQKMNRELIHQWIQKIKNYRIIVLDVPKHREAQKNKNDKIDAIHGEMTIADYLLATAKSESFEKKTLENRKRKLDNVEGGEQGNTLRRIIWFGGTRFDCAKCHEHFQEIKDKIPDNYVISSLRTGTVYGGTENGTNPKSKDMEGEAVIVNVEGLEESFRKTIADLNALKEEIAKTQEKTAAAFVLSDENEKLLQSGEQFLKTVLDEKLDNTVYGGNIAALNSIIEEIKKKIRPVSP